MTPDESWNKGDPRKRGGTYPTTAVAYESSKSEQSPDEHLDELLARIEPCHEAFRMLAKQGESVRLKFAFFSDTENPTFVLSAAVLRRLGELGIDLEGDIYLV